MRSEDIHTGNIKMIRISELHKHKRNSQAGSFEKLNTLVTQLHLHSQTNITLFHVFACS